VLRGTSGEVVGRLDEEKVGVTAGIVTQMKWSRMLREFVRKGPRARGERRGEVEVKTRMGPVARVWHLSRPREQERERVPSGFLKTHRKTKGEQEPERVCIARARTETLNTNRDTKDQDERMRQGSACRKCSGAWPVKYGIVRCISKLS